MPYNAVGYDFVNEARAGRNSKEVAIVTRAFSNEF